MSNNISGVEGTALADRRRSRQTFLTVSVATVVAIGALGLSAPATGAVEVGKTLQPRAGAYQYGNWSQPGSGFTTGGDDTMSQVYQLTWRGSFPDLDDTPGPIYAAGTFIKSGSTTINRVGQWDAGSSSWITLPGDDTGIADGISQSVPSGKGYTKPGVYGLVLGGDDSLYAGGQFWGSDDSLNNVGQWNGFDWIPMGNGLRITTDGDVVQDMVMGNDFIGGDDTNYADDTIYALGGFVGTCATLACTATGTSMTGVAQYSQADDTWFAVGSGAMTSGYGVTPQAFAGAYIDDTLYVGGSFATVGGVSAANIAQWSAAAGTWLPVGAGISAGSQWDGVFSMAVHPITKDLYVGGQFAMPIGGTSAMGGIVKWDYTDDTWYAVGSGLTGGNVDDISFSADGKTMYIGNWANAPVIDSIQANGIARLTSDDLTSTTATTISGSWNYLKSAGVVGVGGPSGSPNQTSTRAVLAQPGDTLMVGGNFHTAGPISAGRVALFTPGAEPSPYDPVYPPGAPTDVVATTGWNKVTVDWTAPKYTGSYPITNYLVTATPSNKVCISSMQDAKLTQCTFTNLTPGTQYTFVVQGLNGGGWGDRSAASNTATAQNLKITSYSRKKIKFLFIDRGSEVKTAAIAPGFDAGTRVVPWTKIGDADWVENSGSSLKVDSSAKFNWSRKFSKNNNGKSVSVKFAIDGNFSNTVVMGPVR